MAGHTFNADGTVEAAPPEEQLDVPPEFCATDDTDDEAEISPAIIGSVHDISHDAATDPRTVTEAEADDQAAAAREQVALRDQRIADAIKKIDAEDAEVVEDEQPGTTVALASRVDVSTLGEKWDHDWLEFKGDKLGIRLPTRQALAAFSLASSKYVSLGVKNDLTGLFIARHLSPESYGRVFSRLMDPDETDYDVDTVGELFNAIVTASIDADKADNAG